MILMDDLMIVTTRLLDSSIKYEARRTWPSESLARSYVVLNRHGSRPCPKNLRAALKHPIMIDGRNLFQPEKMAELGFNYISVGRPEVIVKKERSHPDARRWLTHFSEGHSFSCAGSRS